MIRRIIGAGLAGLVAAHAWRRAEIVEQAPEPAPAHAALLRFRSEAVAHATGIPFRRVRVHKGIWTTRGWAAPNITLANQYAAKVTPQGLPLADRSIWAMEAVDRFIAPETFYEELLENVRGRVAWGERCVPGRDCVTTAPLPETLRALGMEDGGLRWERAPIHVRRWRVNTDVFQTAYYPEVAFGGLYRASITGSLLIAESMTPHIDVEPLEMAFGVALGEELGRVAQRYGKIAPVANDGARRALLGRITAEHGVYSLGRFATWRNVLLDDVVHDIEIIRRLDASGAPHYDERLAAARA